MNVIPLILILIYFLVLFFISVFFVKRTLNSYEEYAFCGRSLTIGFVIFTYLGTWIGGGTIIGLIGTSADKGINQYWIFAISCIVSAIFAFIFLPKIRSKHLRSIGDMFALRYPKYSNFIRLPVSTTLLIRNFTMIGMQFTALGFMMIYAFGIDKEIAILVTFIIITGYTCLSGLWAVVATDIVQGFLQSIGLLLLLFLSIKTNSGIGDINDFINILTEEYKTNLFTSGDHWYNGILYLICFAAFFLMGDQSDWERIYSSKNDKVAFWGYLIPLTITLMLLLIPAIIGPLLGIHESSVDNSEYLLYWFLFEKVVPIVGTFIILTLFSAVMSTADSFMIASGNILANDIIKRFLRKNANEKELIFWTRLGVILSGTVGFAFAITIYDIILLWTSGLAIGTIILIPGYLMMWFSKSMNTEGAITGMLVGLTYCLILLLTNIGFTLFTILIGIALNTISSVVVSTLTDNPDRIDIEHTYYFKFRKNKVMEAKL